MRKSLLENRLRLFAESRNQFEDTCCVILGKMSKSIFLHVLSNSVTSEFISDVVENVCSDFSLFFGTFEPNTVDFLFIYED